MRIAGLQRFCPWMERWRVEWTIEPTINAINRSRCPQERRRDLVDGASDFVTTDLWRTRVVRPYIHCCRTVGSSQSQAAVVQVLCCASTTDVLTADSRYRYSSNYITSSFDVDKSCDYLEFTKRTRSKWLNVQPSAFSSSVLALTITPAQQPNQITKHYTYGVDKQ